MTHKKKGPEWITGWHSAGTWFVPVIATRFSRKDMLGAIRVRWGIGRMRYRVLPGLYATGKPGADSPVLVTANYKLSFDSLRRHLEGIDAWVLVLDTKGVNVWCAAGEGTFGTEEVVRCLKAANLSSVVRHRTLILPQLGAPGVAAHVVTQMTGFNVVYGPVRAADLPRFLEQGMKADPQMRTVTFTLQERLAVIPVELTQTWKIALAALVFCMASQYAITYDAVSWAGIQAFLPYAGAILAGSAAVPAMLPWVPGRSFIFKGWLVGIMGAAVYVAFRAGEPYQEKVALLLLLPAISSFLALNFTGATPYTSLSGVRREMKYGMPLIILSAVSGLVLHFWILWREV